MNCEQATQLISAQLDGELAIDEQRALEAHLLECMGCRATASQLTRQDAELGAALAVEERSAAAVADRVLRRIERENTKTLRMPWLGILMSAAAGFVLAMLIFRPWTTRPSPITIPTTSAPLKPTSAVAKLALATGAIEVRPIGAIAWTPLATGAAVTADSAIRTADKVRCEFELADGSLVRLNGNSEVFITQARRFSLLRGQMFSTVARAPEPFVVAVADAQVTALGTQFDVEVQPAGATVRVLEGMTRVSGGGVETLLLPSEALTIENGRLGRPSRSYNLMIATNWVNELLALKGRDNAELQKRVNELLADLGQVKMAELFEEEIRSLGEHCLIPLTRYLQSPRSTGTESIDIERRRRAARIISDLARPWFIPELIGLLNNSDPQVRTSVSQGLRRLTGESEKPIDDWKRWWERNKGRFDAPAQQSSLPANT